MTEPGDELLFLDENAGEYFEDVAKMKLGKANGNIFNLRPPSDGEPMSNAPPHDGVIMVRLKKKRFLVLDYSKGFYSMNRNQHIDQGRISICISPKCRKVGLPDLIYDSGDPMEGGVSLYLRSGMCFLCQRNVNEKRRTQRKRKADDSSAPTNNQRRSNEALFGSETAATVHQPFATVDAIMTGNVPSSYLTVPGHGVNSANSTDQNITAIRLNIEEASRNLDMLVSESSMMNAPEPDEAVPIIPSAGPSSSSKANVLSLHAEIVLNLRKSLSHLEEWKQANIGKEEISCSDGESLIDAVATAHVAANANNPMPCLLGTARDSKTDSVSNNGNHLEAATVNVNESQAECYSV